MKKTKVLFAYCKELKRSISIDEARVEYFFRKKEERKRFTFSCSDRNCGVLISGVNYHVMAEDGIKFIAAHYRSPHEHKSCCEWVQFTAEVEQAQSYDESDEDFNEKRARLKLKDYVNYFDPLIEDSEKIETDTETTVVSSTESAARNDGQNNSKGNSRWRHYTRTNQLQRLIDTWQEAKEKLSYDEYISLKLHVTNHGKVPFYKYITRINNGVSNQYNGVVFGGGYLKQRYGSGFLFYFFDKIDDKNVHLYVSKDIMNKGRFKHYINEILNTKNVRYFRLFLLNPSMSEREDSNGRITINLEISNLRQLAIYYELKTNTSAESGTA